MWISSTEQKRWMNEEAFSDKKGDELIIKEEYIHHSFRESRKVTM